MRRSLSGAAIALLLVLAADAHAQRTVMLDEDLACDSVEIQKTRVQLTRVVMTTDNEQAKDDASRRLLEIARQHCVPLSGVFKVEGKVNGLLKVLTKDGVEMWLVE